MNQANKHRKELLLEVGDMVWVHLRKDRFPALWQSKLQPRADGPFMVLEKINDNAYRIDLPSKYGVHDVFNVCDLAPFLAGDGLLEELTDSGSNPFQGGEDDVTLDGTSLSDDRCEGLDTSDGALTDDIEDATEEEIEEEPLLPRATPPLTRARARLLGQSVLALERSPAYMITLLQVTSEPTTFEASVETK